MISHLANEDNVGCLPQHRANNQCEVEPDVVPNLDLIDARQVVLDWVLCGDHLAVRTVQRIECSVQGGGLSRSGRASDENDSVGPADEGVEVSEISL